LISIDNECQIIQRWIKRYKSKGMNFVQDEDRSGHPSSPNIEQQEHLKKKIEEGHSRKR